MEEFDWRLTVNFEQGPLDIVCCPEDRQCSDLACLERDTCCQKCHVPVCDECQASFNESDKSDGAVMPPAALANDMMIFYAPKELYTKNVTVMEMICASVCLTSMICFTLEAKYRKENLFDSEVHMARHRM